MFSYVHVAATISFGDVVVQPFSVHRDEEEGESSSSIGFGFGFSPFSRGQWSAPSSEVSQNPGIAVSFS